MRYRVASSTIAVIGAVLLGSCGMPADNTEKQSSTSMNHRRESIPDYEQWTTRTYPNIGMKIELPTDAKGHELHSDEYSRFSAGFHYLSPPPGILDDATRFVGISVERVLLDQFKDEKAGYLQSGMYKRGNEEDHKRWFWHYDLHLETSRWDDGQYSYYRRDVMIGDTEILTAHAEILNAGPQESQAADHAAAKRVLDSIQVYSE